MIGNSSTSICLASELVEVFGQSRQRSTLKTGDSVRVIHASAYFGVLLRPRVFTTFSASLLGRAAYALVFLPLFFTAESAGGSVSFAGLAVAVYGAGAGFMAPVRAWLIDKFKARTVLGALVLAFSGALGALSILGSMAAPGWTILVIAVVAGVVAPPLGPTMRVAWAKLLPDAEDRRIGLSLDAVVEELLYLGGPALAGFLLVMFAPWQVMLVPTCLVLVGGALFICTGVVSEMGSAAASITTSTRGRPLIFDPKFAALLLPAFVAGGLSGMISVVVPAAEGQVGGPGVVGVVLGVFAAGSALGGLIYGAVKLPGSPARQLITGSFLFVIAASMVAWAGDAIVLSMVLALAGLFFSPVMIIAYIAAPAVAKDHQQNAATTWVNTGHNLGSALVSGLAGILVQTYGHPAAVLFISGGAFLFVIAAQVVLSATARRTSGRA